MQHRAEHHRSPKALIPSEAFCQILCWWPTSDFSFQLQTSFLVAKPTSGTILRLPGSFSAPVMGVEVRLRANGDDRRQKTGTELWERLEKLYKGDGSSEKW